MKAKYFLQLVVVLSVILVLAIASGADRDYWPTKDWRTSSPEKQGMDSVTLGKINSHVHDSLPNIKSILVIRHGYLVFEESYGGDLSDLIQLWSGTKSIISILIGIAFKEGYLQSEDQKMIDILTEFVNADLDPQINKVTIHHLLTMSSGCALTGFDPKSMKLIRFYRNEPGKDFYYNETDPQLLSMIITKVTKLKALDFGNKYLFKPLGIKNLKWDEFYGYSSGATGLQLAIRDMAKIGYLYLNNGRWDKKQILSTEWVAESTHAWFSVPRENAEYGFLWWIFQLGGHHSYAAWGWSGQFIYVIPDLDIVIVITGASSSPGASHLSIIDEYVIPAVRN